MVSPAELSEAIIASLISAMGLIALAFGALRRQSGDRTAVWFGANIKIGPSEDCDMRVVHKRILLLVALALLLPCLAVAQQPPVGGGQAGRGGGRGRGGAGVQRDAARQAPTGTGVIGGRVLAADTGRPIKRARVIVSGGGRPHAATTDEQGRYKVTGLAAATYSIAATKTGFVDGTFGQRRALRAGTPIDLTEGQQIADADLKLSRGGVITGHVLDEDGEPLSRAVVTVLRSQYVRGEKQLAPAGVDQTDDRGQFRVFGLPPGEYCVSAAAGGLERIITQVSRLLAPGAAPDQGAETTGYAPTYYPGATTAAEATRVKLAAAQEVGGIDFQIQVVPLATVRGMVTGGPAVVMLLADTGIVGAGGAGAGGGRGGGGGLGALGNAIGGMLAGGQNLRASTQADGTFAISNVIPGKYTIVARTDGGPNGDTRTAVQSIVVTGEEVTVALSPTPGVDVGGTITLEAGSTPVPKNFAGFRVNAVALDAAAALGRPGRPADTTATGQFSMGGVFPGRYMIRGTAPRGWTLKSVYVDGRDATDQPIEIKGESVTGINVIFTDRISSLSGAVRDARSAPLEGVTVIAFPSDDRLWLPQSRQIVTARTDKTGAYRLATIPPGDYLVVAIDDVEQGEWFDPAFLEQIKDGATKVTVGEGEQRTQDLKAPKS